jgi:hypothetical protein
VLAVGAVFVLSGCTGAREALGLTKSAPDEFQVVTRAPLSMPPDFELRAPQPGAPRPQELSARDQAESAIFGGAEDAGGAVSGAPREDVLSSPLETEEPAASADPLAGFDVGGALGPTTSSATRSGGSTRAAPTSSGEAALLDRAGAEGADSTIRSTVNTEAAEAAEADTNFVDRLIFWQPEQPVGEVVDPVKEQQRLQENAALGKPLTEGETPTIERRKRGWLEGVF